jgi:DNA-binding transcriptional ArsR family regulator
MEQGELSVGEIANVAGASRFNTSAHLNRLALGGLAARRRQGSTVYYRVDDQNRHAYVTGCVTATAPGCNWTVG